MADNVVKIVVTAANETAPAFDEAKAGAGETAAAMEELAAAEQKAALASQEEADAAAKLMEVRQSETATAEELAQAEAAQAAAMDKVIAANDEVVAASERVTAAQAETTVATRASGDAAEETAAKQDAAGSRLASIGGKMKMAMLGVAVGMGLAVKSAADFQNQTTHLVTDAGESAKSLGMVQQGILQVSAATGTSASEITDAMYHIESAGFHGAQGLAVLKVAAQGAKVGGAELDTIGKTLTGTMNAYGMSSRNSAVQTRMSVQMMNMLIAAVGAGDMKMQDLAASLGNVAPVAATAKISFGEVGGAIATMTAQNMSAQQATQDLRHTIVSLSNPNAVQIKELKALGLSAHDIQANLGKRGLSGTLELIAEAAKKNAGALGQTYVQAVAKATGGTTGMNTALMLTGTHLATFKANVDTVAGAARKGGDSVDNWSKIQGTLAFKTAQAKASLQDMGISLGTALLPAVTAILGPLAHVLSLIAGNKAASIAFAVVVGGVLAGAIGGKAVKALTDMKEGMSSAADVAEKLIKKMLGMTAAQEGQAAAAEADAAAQEEAAAGSESSWLASFASTAAGAVASAARTVASWAAAAAGMIAQGAMWVAENTARVAVVVAENVAGALATAAAWVIANAVMLLGIGLIVIAVVAAVALIVTHWRQISRFAAEAFHEVLHVVDSAIDWIKSHWPLVLAILTGPIGIAVLAIIKYRDDILHGISDAIDWVRSHWPLLLAILTGPIGLATLWIVDHWRQITAGASEMFHGVVSFFTQLPHRILSVLGDLGHLLWSAGARIISGLIGGIESQFSAVGNAMSGIVGEIKNFLPFSPAKKGPLSGSGAPENSGRSIARLLARGIASGIPDAQGAMQQLAQRLAGPVRPGIPGVPGGYAAAMLGGGTLKVQLELVGGDEPVLRGLRQAIRVRGGNVQLVLGQGGG